MSRRSVSLLTSLKLKVPKNSSLLVAVSGGKDSVALLDGLVKVQRLLSLRIEVAHVDHGQRPNSAEEASFVEHLAKKYNLKFHTKLLLKPTVKTNIENWGRKERYFYFKELLKQNDLSLIVTAHHSNDVAETFLMRLVSNKELRSIHAWNSKHKVLRPLLTISRKEIEKYIAHNNLEFREDESNSNIKFLRNKVRHVLLPELQKTFHERAPKWIAERAQALDSDSRCLDGLAKAILKGLKEFDFDSEEFQASLKGQPLAIALRMVEFALLERLKFRLGRSRAKVARRVILGQLKQCHLPGGYWLGWRQKRLVLMAGRP